MQKLDIKTSLVQAVSSYIPTEPLKGISNYKGEMTLSQVITFFERQGVLLTKTMVQNYVRVGVIPPLVNKRYYDRRHMCMLVIVSLLKDIYSLEEIRLVFSPHFENVEPLYKSFIEMYSLAVIQWQNDFINILENLEQEGVQEDMLNFSASSLMLAQALAATIISKRLISK